MTLNYFGVVQSMATTCHGQTGRHAMRHVAEAGGPGTETVCRPCMVAKSVRISVQLMRLRPATPKLVPVSVF